MERDERTRTIRLGKGGTRPGRRIVTTPPRGRGPYRIEEAAKAIHLYGRDIPKSSVAYPRNGTHDNPTLYHPEALATFVGVKPPYFSEGEVARETRAAPSAPVAPREAGEAGEAGVGHGEGHRPRWSV
ncbi:hypothetical protein ACFXHB_33580, partial [Kitasatospora sp. NPDC059327]